VEWLALVDVELIALWVFHRDRVMIEALFTRGAENCGTEIRQPLCLGVDSLPPGCDRDRPSAADVDVEVQRASGSGSAQSITSWYRTAIGSPIGSCTGGSAGAAGYSGSLKYQR
jgi:hypothetical protein